MIDLQVSPFTFSATEVEVSAASDAGKDFLGSLFGVGAVSIKLPKSKAVDFAEFATRKGLTVN